MLLRTKCNDDGSNKRDIDNYKLVNTHFAPASQRRWDSFDSIQGD